MGRAAGQAAACDSRAAEEGGSNATTERREPLRWILDNDSGRGRGLFYDGAGGLVTPRRPPRGSLDVRQAEVLVAWISMEMALADPTPAAEAPGMVC